MRLTRAPPASSRCCRPAAGRKVALAELGDDELAPLTIISQSIARQNIGRKQQGGTVARPRAADDFTTIRARLNELRRERAAVPPDDKPHRPDPRPDEISGRPPTAEKSGLSPELRRMLLRGRSA